MAEPLHLHIRRLIADRHSPQTAALFRTLHGLVARRAARRVRARYRDLLSETDVDEIVADVLMTLMQDALGRFRGETEASLHAFVGVITDRAVSRQAHRHLRERDTVEDAVTTREAVFARSPSLAPDARAEVDVDTPLDKADQLYLSALLRAGSRAELARREGVSRAAVTQRLRRIDARLARLDDAQRARHEAWLTALAQATVEAQAVGSAARETVDEDR